MQCGKGSKYRLGNHISAKMPVTQLHIQPAALIPIAERLMSLNIRTRLELDLAINATYLPAPRLPSPPKRREILVQSARETIVSSNQGRGQPRRRCSKQNVRNFCEKHSYGIDSTAETANLPNHREICPAHVNPSTPAFARSCNGWN